MTEHYATDKRLKDFYTLYREHSIYKFKTNDYQGLFSSSKKSENSKVQNILQFMDWCTWVFFITPKKVFFSEPSYSNIDKLVSLFFSPLFKKNIVQPFSFTNVQSSYLNTKNHKVKPLSNFSKIYWLLDAIRAIFMWHKNSKHLK